MDNGPDKTPAQSAANWREAPFRRLVESVTDYAIFLLDPEGNVATWSRGAQLIQGYEAGEIVGRHFSVFYPRAAIERGWPAHELETARRLGHFEDEGWRVRKDGTSFWANVVITAMRDDEGRLLGFGKIVRDLSERRAHEEKLRAQEEALRQSEERFRVLLEGVRDYAIFMLDPEGRVTSWNGGAERILGYRAPEIVGQSFERFFTLDEREQGRPAEELREATLQGRFEDRGWRLRKDGTRFWSDVVITSLRDPAGRLRGFAKVTRDLSERKRMESLEEQGRHLTEFLAMLAHELRNPLAPIRSALGIIGMNKDLPGQVAWARDVIERQAVHLTRLVEDLLDVSRITRGKLRLRNAPMDLRAAAHRAIESARPIVDQRRHRLHVSMPPGTLPVHGDVTRLTQVVQNLLNNAAKYTPEGGDIWLEVRGEGDEAVIVVRDNGVGITPHVLERVFDLFAQGERTIDRSEGGMGIGLTLARRIVILHGGEIEARSEGAGHGAEFVVTLPRLRAEVMVPAPQPHDVELASGGRKRSILVVDDNVDTAASMAMLLRMGGHDVEIEHDGPQALRRVSEHVPDIMLLDIGLPSMSGYDVASELRSRPELKRMRIFAMTGYGQEEDRRRSLASGFDGHLVKPVLPADLLGILEEPTGP
jgi:PAS domain S-box-containing protein